MFGEPTHNVDDRWLYQQTRRYFFVIERFICEVFFFSENTIFDKVRRKSLSNQFDLIHFHHFEEFH